ncbi:MAG TPA: hypothetical protein VF943_09330, partial [Burkholderiales bacterium]
AVSRVPLSEGMKPSSLLATSSDESPEVMMALTDDGGELKVMERRKGDDVRFYSIQSRRALNLTTLHSDQPDSAKKPA